MDSTDSVELQECRRCHREKPLTDFYPRERSRWCKECRKESTKKYLADNPDRRKFYWLTANEKRRDQMREYARKYYDEHREYYREYARQYRARKRADRLHTLRDNGLEHIRPASGEAAVETQVPVEA